MHALVCLGEGGKVQEMDAAYYIVVLASGISCFGGQVTTPLWVFLADHTFWRIIQRVERPCAVPWFGLPCSLFAHHFTGFDASIGFPLWYFDGQG
jgi:hypothetical protein